jgi:hypothetical protein
MICCLLELLVLFVVVWLIPTKLEGKTTLYFVENKILA